MGPGRGAGALVSLVAAGVKTREEILNYFAELFHGKLTDKNDVAWSELGMLRHGLIRAGTAR